MTSFRVLNLRPPCALPPPAHIASSSWGQISPALAYYWDYTEELDRDLARRPEKVEEKRRAVAPSALKEKLKPKGLI